MVLAAAGAALVLATLAACLRWLAYPHVKLTIINESAAAISDVRIDFLYGERTAERIEPGAGAVTEIQSGGDAGVYISYRDSGGALADCKPLYYSPDAGGFDRGFLEVHITDEDTRVVNGTYQAIDIPIFTIRVSPTGNLTVKGR
jgi:hypothetical protein